MFHLLNQKNAFSLFSLFFGTVGIGFALIAQSHYVLISLMIASVAFVLSQWFIQDETSTNPVFDQQILALSYVVVYGVLPVVLLNSISYGSIIAVIVGAIFLLAVVLRIAYYGVESPIISSQSSTGLPLEVIAILIPLICLLAYIIPSTVFYVILCVVMAILAVGFVLEIKIPMIPREWLLYVLGYMVLMVIAYIFLGSFTPVIAS